MTFQEFQCQVLSLGFFFGKDNTTFYDRTAPRVGTYYEAHAGFSSVTYDGKFQILINGSNTNNDKLKHKNIKKALVLAERRASCWQHINYQQKDTYNESTFDFSV